MKFIKKSFTLVELLLVIAIIGILTTIIIVGLAESRKKGHDSQRMSDLNTVASALANFYSENHFYPSPTSAPAVTNYSELISVLRLDYLSSAPHDPIDDAATGYVYYYEGTATSYMLGACLETNSGATADPMGLTTCSGETYQLVNGEPAA